MYFYSVYGRRGVFPWVYQGVALAGVPWTGEEDEVVECTLAINGQPLSTTMNPEAWEE